MVFSDGNLEYTEVQNHPHVLLQNKQWLNSLCFCYFVLQTHIHSAALAGGVTVGYAAESIEYPWIAMILGLLASVMSILGSLCLQVALKAWNSFLYNFCKLIFLRDIPQGKPLFWED